MMRTIAAVLLLAAAACQSSTVHGECIGVFGDQDPALRYRVSTRNVVLGIVFIETVFVPAVVVLSEIQCPVGRIPQPKAEL